MYIASMPKHQPTCQNYCCWARRRNLGMHVWQVSTAAAGSPQMILQFPWSAPIWISRTSRILGQVFHANIHLGRLSAPSSLAENGCELRRADSPKLSSFGCPGLLQIFTRTWWRCHQAPGASQSWFSVEDPRMGDCQEFMDYQKYMHSQSQFQDRVPLMMQCGIAKSDRLSWPKVCATPPFPSQTRNFDSFCRTSQSIWLFRERVPLPTANIWTFRSTPQVPLAGATAMLEMFETDGLCTYDMQCPKL